MGRRAALVIASVLFGLSHFNKRSPTFNWRYVLAGHSGGNFLRPCLAENRRYLPRPSPTPASDWSWSLCGFRAQIHAKESMRASFV